MHCEMQRNSWKSIPSSISITPQIVHKLKKPTIKSKQTDEWRKTKQSIYEKMIPNKTIPYFVTNITDLEKTKKKTHKAIISHLITSATEAQNDKNKKNHNPALLLPSDDDVDIQTDDNDDDDNMQNEPDKDDNNDNDDENNMQNEPDKAEKDDDDDKNNTQNEPDKAEKDDDDDKNNMQNEPDKAEKDDSDNDENNIQNDSGKDQRYTIFDRLDFLLQQKIQNLSDGTPELRYMAIEFPKAKQKIIEEWNKIDKLKQRINIAGYQVYIIIYT